MNEINKQLKYKAPESLIHYNFKLNENIDIDDYFENE